MIKSQRIKVSGSHHAYSCKMTYINYINIDVSMYIYIYVCKLSIYNHQQHNCIWNFWFWLQVCLQVAFIFTTTFDLIYHSDRNCNFELKCGLTSAGSAPHVKRQCLPGPAVAPYHRHWHPLHVYTTDPNGLRCCGQRKWTSVLPCMGVFVCASTGVNTGAAVDTMWCRKSLLTAKQRN